MFSGSFDREGERETNVLVVSGADAEDGVPGSDRWAQAQPVAIIPITRARNTRRRNKRNPFEPKQHYLQVYPRNRIVAYPIDTRSVAQNLSTL